MARDLDTVRFRADTTVNETIRQVAAESGGGGRSPRLTSNASSRHASPDGIPGEDVFLEHVHLNFHGNYLLARSVLHKLREVLPPSRARSGRALSRADVCASGWRTPAGTSTRTRCTSARCSAQPPFTNQFDAAERDQRWEKRLQGLRQQRQPEQLKKTLAQYQQASPGQHPATG